MCSFTLRFLFDIINYICVIGVCVLVGWRGFRESLATWHYNMSSDTLHVPFYPFYWVLVFGYVLLLLVVVTIIIRTLRKTDTK